jgi:hypothetical protein
VTVHPARDAGPATWIGASPEVDDWARLQFGPPCFESYVRVNLTTDDELDAWEEATEPSAPKPDSIKEALEVLLDHTTTPDDAYAGIWDGWRMQPALPKAPRIAVAGRSLLLFTGTVLELRFAAGTAWNGEPTDGGAEPHWLWPADHSWFLACEVDEYVDFSIGCSTLASSSLAARFGPRARLVPYGTE